MHINRFNLKAHTEYNRTRVAHASSSSLIRVEFVHEDEGISRSLYDAIVFILLIAILVIVVEFIIIFFFYE